MTWQMGNEKEMAIRGPPLDRTLTFPLTGLNAMLVEGLIRGGCPLPELASDQAVRLSLLLGALLRHAQPVQLRPTFALPSTSGQAMLLLLTAVVDRIEVALKAESSPVPSSPSSRFKSC